jgi:hypothetical protein
MAGSHRRDPVRVSPGWLCAVLLALVFLAGCTQTAALLREEKLGERAAPARVLLMPIDLKLAELTAGGLAAPKADWTAAANERLDEALRAEMAARNVLLVDYRRPADADQAHRHEQLMKLHNAVAGTILRYKVGSGARLSTKKGPLDWTLGAGVGALRSQYQADYALFLVVRDTYASADRTLLSVVLSLLYLFPVLPGSGQQGYASLVDLRSGELVWFNLLVSSTGDLRSAEPARAAVKELLAKLPL